MEPFLQIYVVLTENFEVHLFKILQVRFDCTTLIGFINILILRKNADFYLIFIQHDRIFKFRLFVFENILHEINWKGIEIAKRIVEYETYKLDEVFLYNMN